MCCKCCSVRQQKIWVFTLSTLFLVVGVLSICQLPGMIRKIVNNELPLSLKSKTFKKWIVTPVPIYMHIYLWNWTNPDEVRDLDVKPNFVPMGPFVFRDHKVKEDLVWHPNNTVTYLSTQTWFFEPEMTNGTLEDLVTCPHIPTLAAATMMRDRSKLEKIVLNAILNKEGGMLAVTKTADEWLFKGYFDRFLDFAMKLNISDIPYKSSYFALFLNRNGSKEYDGTYTVHTGKGNLTQLGELTHWKGRSHTGFYEGECGKVNGSTGDLFVPNRPEDEAITMFVPDTCRFTNLFPGERVRLFGIDGIKYSTNDMTFDSGEKYPNMKCFCPPELKECPKPGAIDMSPCFSGVPMYMSHNNFYLADPSYSEQITGLAPDPEKDTYFLVMEPTLGVPLLVNAAIMISLRIRRDDDFKVLRGIRDDFYVPFFSVSQKAEIGDDLASEVRLVLMLPAIGLYTGIVFASIGAIMLVIGIYLTISHNWKGQRREEKEN